MTTKIFSSTAVSGGNNGLEIETRRSSVNKFMCMYCELEDSFNLLLKNKYNQNISTMAISPSHAHFGSALKILPL